MIVLESVGDDTFEDIRLGTPEQEAAIEALWDDPEEIRLFEEACDSERVELFERVRRLGNIGADFDFESDSSAHAQESA